MAEARQRDSWNHTAALLAMLANVHRDPKKSRALSPTDFHPLPAPGRTATAHPKAEIGILKTIFVDRRLGD